VRFAEVFLRLGCSLVGWMMLYAHAVWLAALHRIGCGPDGGEMHALLLGIAPMAAAMSFLPRLTRPFTDIQSILRWLALPLALLLPFELYNIWSVAAIVHGAGAGICGESPPVSWHYWWTPAQVGALSICWANVLTVWLNSTRDAGDRPATEPD